MSAATNQTTPAPLPIRDFDLAKPFITRQQIIAASGWVVAAGLLLAGAGVAHKVGNSLPPLGSEYVNTNSGKPNKPACPGAGGIPRLYGYFKGAPGPTEAQLAHCKGGVG